MVWRVDSRKIEGIVGATRHPNYHIARAVSSEQTVYILHSRWCLDRESAGVQDLIDCPYSKALDRGIDMEEWVQDRDRPVRVTVWADRLVPDHPAL